MVGCTTPPQVDVAAEVQAIRELDRQWQAAVDAKDVEATISFYAPDAVKMEPNAPTIVGIDRFREAFEAWLPLPNVSNQFAPDLIEVAASGDMAWDRGTYHFVMETPDGPIEDVGKYLMVWKKISGEWKVIAECGNSDLPAGQE
jgi:ketosteroid isomerase-like protein